MTECISGPQAVALWLSISTESVDALYTLKSGSTSSGTGSLKSVYFVANTTALSQLFLYLFESFGACRPPGPRAPGSKASLRLPAGKIRSRIWNRNNAVVDVRNSSQAMARSIRPEFLSELLEGAEHNANSVNDFSTPNPAAMTICPPRLRHRLRPTFRRRARSRRAAANSMADHRHSYTLSAGSKRA